MSMSSFAASACFEVGFRFGSIRLAETEDSFQVWVVVTNTESFPAPVERKFLRNGSVIA